MGGSVFSFLFWGGVVGFRVWLEFGLVWSWWVCGEILG